MALPAHFFLVEAQPESRTVVCSGVQLKSDAAGLRCRFGNQEVPAQSDGNLIKCCAPPLPSDATDKKVPLQVLLDGNPVAEDVFDYSALEKQRLQDHGALDSCCPAGTAASCSAPPAGDMEMTAAGGGANQVPTTESRKDFLKREFSALKPFVIISLSYLLFTTTDGAIRMIVLLHAYNAGFTAWEVAIMFTCYEVAGVFTNLLAGLAGAKWGIKTTLMTGLSLQIVGISLLFAWQDSWSEEGQKWKAILFVTMAQLPCGVAKDLTKLGGKTVTKLVTPDEKQTRLFKLVSFITGWKNSLKGAGYFLGSLCITFNYYFALGVLLLLILAAFPWAAVGLSNQLGRTRKENLSWDKILKQPFNINVLSVSRFFLFGSRDMWFEVPLPYFLRDTVAGLGWSRPLTGLFLAVWIITYGQVQSWTPQLVLQPLQQSPANKYVAVLYNMLLVLCPLYMALFLQTSTIFQDHDVGGMTAVLVSGLAAFCLVFAVNSAVHSYLIVRYAEGDKVAMNVGYYYMANAMGRLTGTLVSGALYSFVSSNVVDGFAACFWASVGFAALSALVEVFLRDNSGGLHCSSCLTLVPAPPQDHDKASVTVEVEGS